MATLGEVAFILKRIADAYGKPVSDERVKVYYSVLRRFPRMVLVAASTRLLESSSYFPQINEIAAAAKQLGAGYEVPEWAKLDEAMNWYLYTHNLTSSDELSEADVEKICKDAGVDQERDARPVRELSAAEVRAVCQARGLPVSRRVEPRQAEPVLY